MSMKVMGIKAESFKKLSLVNLELKGENLIVAGAPGEGKTTLVGLAWAALKKDASPKPVQDGKESAYVEIKLGGEAGKTRTITVRREYDADGSDKLKVKASDGTKVGISDITRLIQSISFDPLDFYQRKGMEQVNILLQLLGVSLGDIESRRKELYEERTTIGRVARAHRDSLPAEPPKTERVSLSTLSAQLAEAQEYNRLVAERNVKLGELKDKRQALTTRLEELEKEMAVTRVDLGALNLRITKGEEICATHQPKDLAPITLSIQQVEETNRKAEAHERWLADSEKADVHDKRYRELDQAIAAIDGEKEAKLKDAKWPLPGLNVDGDVVMYKGIPLVQAGEGKKLEVSFAIATALNPELRICRIDGAESLGAGGRAEILRIAEANDMQVFMSRVSDGEAEEGEIVIVNGMASK